MTCVFFRKDRDRWRVPDARDDGLVELKSGGYPKGKGIKSKSRTVLHLIFDLEVRSCVELVTTTIASTTFSFFLHDGKMCGGIHAVFMAYLKQVNGEHQKAGFVWGGVRPAALLLSVISALCHVSPMTRRYDAKRHHRFHLWDAHQPHTNNQGLSRERESGRERVPVCVYAFALSYRTQRTKKASPKGEREDGGKERLGGISGLREAFCVVRVCADVQTIPIFGCIDWMCVQDCRIAGLREKSGKQVPYCCCALN